MVTGERGGLGDPPCRPPSPSGRRPSTCYVALRASLAHAPVLDLGEATISAEDEQSTRTRIWCAAPIGEPRAGPGSRRCERLVDHPGPCAAR
ncbi:hypothetical protein [Plantactinospora sp. WMMB782]|uniref:hypothetical protein n=1 Tax=Plantactinospora sp. WMMB782 TaxID=3404121 RepID=UPI003B939D8E